MTPVAVVVNAGPLMVLAKLNLLHLLKQLYGRVYFADTVYREVVIDGMRYGYADASTLFQFLRQEAWQPTTVAAIPPSIQAASLDLGGQESIALAMMQQALLLIDEEAGRRVARSLGLTVRGSLGVLIDAYRHRLINADQLRFNFAEIERRIETFGSAHHFVVDYCEKRLTTMRTMTPDAGTGAKCGYPVVACLLRRNTRRFES